MKRLRHLLIILALAALFTTAFCTAAYAATTDLKIEVTYQQSTARQMLPMINEFRTGSDAWAWNSNKNKKIYYTGLSELQYDYELEKAAMQRAAEIAVLFAHTRPDGTDSSSAGGWGTSSSIYGYTCGENIAGGSSTAKAVFTDWCETDEPYKKQGHRRNMLSENFTAVGIGHVVVNGIHYWVQQFGASPHTTATEPRNETVEMTIPVQESYITSVTLAFRNSGVSSMRIPYRTEHMQIPEVRTAVMLVCPGVYGGESWPSAAPVKADLTWTSSDTGVVEVNGTTLRGVYPGSANVTTSWRGKTLSLGITVTPLNISGYTVTAADAVYTGEALKPEVTVTPPEEGATPLTAGTDYTVIYQNNTDAGTASVQVTGRGPYTGTTGGSFTITPADISGASAAAIPSSVYDASAKEPAVTVTYKGRTLTGGEDYTVSYQNNINAGTASAVLAGSGNFKGSLTKNFTILPVQLSDYEISEIPDAVYTGSAITPAVTVESLPEGAVFETEYEDNLNAGTASVNVSGSTNCAGTLSSSFTIKPADITGDDFTVTAASQYWTGEALRPVMTVKRGETQLAEGTDYEIDEDSWQDNIDGETGSFRISGTGNYKGTRAGTFRILRHDLKSTCVDDPDSIPDQTYTGEEIKPLLRFVFEGEVLREGTDYIRQDTDNINVGTASVIFRGINRFGGTFAAEYKILPASIEGGSLTGPGSVTYTGSAQTPDFTLKVNGLTLEEGRDYTASWSGNVNAGTASLVLTGKGNYTGTKETAFTIRPVSLSDYSIPSIDDVTYTGKAQKPSVSIPGLPDGAAVLVEYADNTDAGTATVTVSGTHNCTGTLTATFTILPKSISGATVAAEDQVYSGEALTPAVTVTLGGKTLAEGKDYVIPADGYGNNVEKGQASVRVTGCGNYTGSAAGTFRIGGISVAKAKTAGDLVVLGDVNEKHELVSRTYTGAAHKPELVLKYKEETLVEGTDYTRKDSGNLNAGDAKIVITGRDRFEGELVLKYKILAADITAASLKVPNYTYSGKENKPVPTVTLGDKKLVLGQDFEIVRYATIVNAGNGAVKIMGIGNYAGEKVVKFKIAKLDLSKAFKLAPIATQYYTGSPVTTKSYTLNRIMEKAAKPVEGKDYTVAWWNNKNVSTANKPASLVLTAKPNSTNYTGRIKLDFKIVYRPKGTAFNTSAGYFKITKAGPNGTAEAVFVKPKNATAQAQKVLDKVTWQKVTYKVTSVAAGAFKGNKYMTSLTVGSLVKTIGANAFSGCPKLKSVVIGGAVTTIGKQAFYKDGGLKAITIRSKLLTAKTVGAEAFKGIYGKAYIKVPAAKVKAYRTILTGRGASANITVVGA